jgi:hypothetical protein
LLIAELWDSDEFFWIMRVILPILNGIGVVTSVLAVFLRKKMMVQSDSKSNNAQNNQLVLKILICELCSCIIRLVYCAVGPFYCNSNFQLLAHRIIMNVPFSFEIIGMLLTISLLIRWGAFEVAKKNQIFEKALFILAWVVLPCQITVAVLQIYSQGVQSLVYFGVLFVLIVNTGGTIIFIKYGYAFVKSLNSSGKEGIVVASSWRQRQLRWAIKWIMMSGFAKLIILAGTFLALDIELFYSPTTWFVSYVLFYMGMTIQSLAQIIALFPTHQARRELTKQSSRRFGEEDRQGSFKAVTRQPSSNAIARFGDGYGGRSVDSLKARTSQIGRKDSNLSNASALNNVPEDDILVNDAVLDMTDMPMGKRPSLLLQEIRQNSEATITESNFLVSDSTDDSELNEVLQVPANGDVEVKTAIPISIPIATVK